MLKKQIRDFELKMHALYKKGLIFGTTHLAVGQEDYAIRIVSDLSEGDVIVSHHRNHAHYLAATQDFEGLENILRYTSGGQHLHIKNKFYANGIQGGMCPIACGMAMAMKLEGLNNLVVIFIGDGTLGQGVLYESLNMCGLWKLPIIFVVELNGYAMSTPTEKAVSGDIRNRFKAFGLSECGYWRESMITSYPAFILINTTRLCGHSPRDDQKYRPISERELWQQTLSK